MEKQLNNIATFTNAISVVVVVKRIQLPPAEVKYINTQVKAGWTPDTIVGRGEHHISCSMRTPYRTFKRGDFDVQIAADERQASPQWLY